MESPSPWILEVDERVAFVGDVLYHDVHSYLSDGHSGEWLANLDQLEKTLDVKTLFPGHGAPGQEGLFEQQRGYLQLFRKTVAELAQGRATLTAEAKQQLVATMKTYLASDALEFLISLGADPVATELHTQHP
jgi:glyoxylase-like metal-dependent hydrolase (beta-lactamase superfamily II)